MNILNLTISENPIPKKRSRKGKNGWYNPQSDIMNQTRIIIKNQLHDSFKIIPKNIPVIANISWFFEPAKSQKTKKFLDLIKNDDYPYIKKKDRDNLDKFILDVCNKIIWYDDAQAYKGTIEKYYSMNPRTEIEVIWDEKKWT